mmetsp:Transcript_52990/g.106227  ORF Transcript_52990/g.106227 Transcript_52990/m.106227 type:complete len:392 (-) Transcript_52990:535-1710(-)
MSLVAQGQTELVVEALGKPERVLEAEDEPLVGTAASDLLRREFVAFRVRFVGPGALVVGAPLSGQHGFFALPHFRHHRAPHHHRHRRSDLKPVHHFVTPRETRHEEVDLEGEAEDGREDQVQSEKAEPSVVEGNLFPEVGSNVVERLAEGVEEQGHRFFRVHVSGGDGGGAHLAARLFPREHPTLGENFVGEHLSEVGVVEGDEVCEEGLLQELADRHRLGDDGVGQAEAVFGLEQRLASNRLVLLEHVPPLRVHTEGPKRRELVAARHHVGDALQRVNPSAPQGSVLFGLRVEHAHVVGRNLVAIVQGLQALFRLGPVQVQRLVLDLLVVVALEPELFPRVHFVSELQAVVDAVRLLLEDGDGGSDPAHDEVAVKTYSPRQLQLQPRLGT